MFVASIPRHDWTVYLGILDFQNETLQVGNFLHHTTPNDVLLGRNNILRSIGDIKVMLNKHVVSCSICVVQPFKLIFQFVLVVLLFELFIPLFLPSSQAKVKTVRNDAQTRMMESLVLSDPRIMASNYLFFGQNPLSLPPVDCGSVLGDINT
jgi:hypothetical protein